MIVSFLVQLITYIRKKISRILSSSAVITDLKRGLHSTFCVPTEPGVLSIRQKFFCIYLIRFVLLSTTYTFPGYLKLMPGHNWQRNFFYPSDRSVGWADRSNARILNDSHPFGALLEKPEWMRGEGRPMAVLL